MGVVRISSEQTVDAGHWPNHKVQLVKRPGEVTCFYCKKPLTSGYAAYWNGTTELYLHAPCLVELTIRMYRDVHEVELLNHKNVTPGTP